MKRYIIVPIIIFLVGQIYGQEREFIGGRSSSNIAVSSSHNFGLSNAANTINGTGLDADLMAASRFLYQAGMGGDVEDIIDLTLSGDYEGWLDAQMQLDPSYLLQKVIDINAEEFQYFIAQRDDEGNLNDPDDYFGPWMKHFSYAWWDNVAKAPDQLRLKVAHALSQILVVSFNSDIQNHGEAMAAYYDLLLDGAFGNYRDILMDVTMSPTMGYYLSHLNNPKTNVDRNRHPDENYAREIMQLFTIGLYELNMDGTRKLDEEGEPIATYNNGHIGELAKVFTGLIGGDLNEKIKLEYPDAELEFGAGYYVINRMIPMQMFERQHELGSKTIVGDYVIPAGQSGMKDIEDAVDHLFNHDNVPPFVSYRLIQRMVKSNPSPDYVERVSNVFADNGNGVRGDMKAVIKAILLDEEARSCEYVLDPAQGMLREPILRHTHVMHALPNDSPTGNYWKDPLSLFELTKQTPQGSPTVFNFYSPDFTPIGDVANADLVAPEFKILDSETSIGYANQVLVWTFWESLMYDWEDRTPDVNTVFDELQNIGRNDNEALIHQIDILFTHGQMSDLTRGVIRRALGGVPSSQFAKERAQFALYLTLISPDYTILK